MIYVIFGSKKNFHRQGEPLPKKNSKFFLLPNMTIHTPFDSPYRVYKKLVVFENVLGDYWSKNPKNSVLEP
jgi:hypothetical protein